MCAVGTCKWVENKRALPSVATIASMMMVLCTEYIVELLHHL